MDIEAKKKYEILKAKNEGMKFEKKWKSNKLFMECIDLLKKCMIMSKEESEALFQQFQGLVPIRYGRVDWKKMTNYAKTSIEEIKQSCNRDKEYYILWDDYDVPCVHCCLQTIIDNIDDVLAVTSNTWLLSEAKDEIIEFYHEGEIVYGEIV